MRPLGIVRRESRDSEEHPESLGIVFALDVSGSMGDIAAGLATRTLPHFMQTLLQVGMRDPQLMFMAVGNAMSDAAPIQIGQFESTERLIDRWLTSIYIERGGGGAGSESYELAFYFAAHHTEMSCVLERGRRGYLFITGDEKPNLAVSKTQVRMIFGDEIEDDIPIRTIIEECQRCFEPFFLIPTPELARPVERAWRDLLGDRVIVMGHPDDTSFVAAGLVSLLEGGAASVDALLRRLAATGIDDQRLARIGRALLPFAASVGRDGAPRPCLGDRDLPRGDSPSGHER
jgi:hypothetical protein